MPSHFPTVAFHYVDFSPIVVLIIWSSTGKWRERDGISGNERFELRGRELYRGQCELELLVLCVR